MSCRLIKLASTFAFMALRYVHALQHVTRRFVNVHAAHAGQSAEAGDEDRREMANALSNLALLSEEFIHRHGPELLEKALKPKMEHILLMRLSDLQHKLYELYIEVRMD